jgi:hypothetical protein
MTAAYLLPLGLTPSDIRAPAGMIGSPPRVEGPVERLGPPVKVEYGLIDCRDS